MLRDSASPEELDRWYRRTPDEIEAEKAARWNASWRALRLPDNLARKPDILTGARGDARLAGGAGADRLTPNAARARPVASAATPRPDPNKVGVFQRGPDGKLHPVPGWKTTGPFEYGTWSHNIDWPGVGRDLVDIGAGVAGFLMPAAGIGSVLDPFAKAALAANFWNIGRDTTDDLREIDGRRPPTKTR